MPKIEIKRYCYSHPSVVEVTGYEGTIQPDGDSPGWVLYFRPDGSGTLWTHRQPSGAVVGDPIELPALATEPADVTSEES